MKVQTRKILTKEYKEFDEDDKKWIVITEPYENGYVEEIEINNPEKDITAFSLEKSVRIIGIGKKLYPLTYKSWQLIKKELNKLGLLQRFQLTK